MIVDESPVTNEEQDTTINTEEEDNSVSTSGEEFSCLYAKYRLCIFQFNLHEGGGHYSLLFTSW